MRKRVDISRLLSLLDDEDEAVALDAMAELLARGDEIGEELARIQDSSDPLLRKRVHQLAAALTMRRRRSEFARLLAVPEPDVCEVLVQLHLQWFDNDSHPEMVSRLESFLTDGRRRRLRLLEEIAYYMRKCGFAAERETTLRPENYCIGVVLTERIGSSALLCLLCRELVRHEAEIHIVRFMDDFALCDGERLLLPERDWRIVRAPSREELEFWDSRRVLKFAAMMLFSSAVNSDSFRYVLTIGQAVSGLPDDEVLDYLPYPYRPAPEDDAEPASGGRA